jgi:hypothetical protein
MTSPNQNNKSWLHRVLDERIELEKKVDALRLFLGSSAVEKLGSVAQADLREQLYHMDSYLWVLQRRIRAATQTNI